MFHWEYISKMANHKMNQYCTIALIKSLSYLHPTNTRSEYSFYQLNSLILLEIKETLTHLSHHLWLSALSWTLLPDDALGIWCQGIHRALCMNTLGRQCPCSRWFSTGLTSNTESRKNAWKNLPIFFWLQHAD